MSDTETTLRISGDLALPVEAVTETFAVLGMRGSGKTSTAVVMVEEMLRAGLPVVVVDPIGVWWGLRSDAEGTGPGLSVVIFGGDHADLPLTEGSGSLLADTIVDHRVPAVLDLSGLSKSAARRFVADFAERLYQRNRDALHVVFDEADLWAPQRVADGGQRLLGAIEDYVRRGRARGLGCSLITQRPAVLNKDVLSQAGALVALKMSGKHDVAAIDDWVRLHADPDAAATMKASLPSLAVGTAWVWSPGWLNVLQKVAVRRRDTFDSSATPKVGERRIEPQRMAEVDLAALGEQIAAIEDQAKAKGDDPVALRKRVADLERQLATRPAPEPVEPERVEVPVLSDEHAAELREAVATLSGVVERLSERLTQVAGPRPRPEPATNGHRPTPVPAPRERPRRETPAATGVTEGLKAGARKMLDVLGRQHPIRVSRAQLGTLSGFKHTGGTFGSYLSALRGRDLIDERDGLLGLTDAGMAATDADAAPVGRDELLDQYRSVLKAGARKMLDLVVEAHPRPVPRADLAERAGFEASGGTFGSYLSTLRRNGLVEADGDGVTLAPVLADA